MAGNPTAVGCLNCLWLLESVIRHGHVEDGLKAVVMGMAAQESARTGQAIEFTDEGYSFSGC